MHYFYFDRLREKDAIVTTIQNQTHNAALELPLPV